MKRLILLLIACSCIVSVHAAYLKDVPMTLTQPDGTVLHCFASGDEFFNYLHDANGFTIMQHPQTGYYVYAEKRDGELVATNYVAGVVDPASKGLTPYALISPEEWMARRRARERYNEPNRDAGLNHGTLNNIAIFIRFKDDNEFTNSFSSIDNMFNNESQNAISMINYFKSASYNAITIHTHFYPEPIGETIISYQDIHYRSYYEPESPTNPNGYDSTNMDEREFGLLERAVNYVKDSIPSALNIDHNNDGKVDNVCFIVKAGVSGEILWPHKYTLHDRTVTINGKQVYTYNLQLAEADPTLYFNTSTMCHEMNHTLGAPDLYHYKKDPVTHITLGPDPVGKWDLMKDNTTPPQHCGAYMKWKYGHWINEIPEITQAGTYTLNPISSPTPTNIAYKIQSDDPNQFYVVEYRKNTTLFETGLPGSGLLIYRIDNRFNNDGNSNAWYDPSNGIYDEVYIFRPGGTSSVNGDLNHAYFSSDEGRTEFGASTSASAHPFFTGGTPDNYFRIYNITSAGNTISFDYGPEPPTNLVATVNDNDVSLSWDAAAYAQSYNIYRDGSLIGNTSGTTYFDSNLEYGCYTYRLKSVDVKGLLSKASEPAVAIIVPEDIDTIYYSETICRRAGFFGVFGQGNNVVTVSLSRDETDVEGSQTFYRSIKNSVTGTVTGILILTITTEGAVSEHTLPPVTVNRCDLIDDDNCYHWNIGDESYCCNHTDRYEKVFNREGECDSVVYLDLTIIEPESTVFEDTLLCFNSFCQPFNYHGKQITTAGVYYACENDVFYTLDVGLIDTIPEVLAHTICTDEAPFTWRGHTLPWTTPGNYDTVFRVITTECMCDTIFYISLSILDCCEPPLDCLEDELEDGDRSNSSNLETIYYGLKHYFDYRGAMNGFLANVLRGVTWPSIDERNTFWNLFQSLLDANSGMMSEEAMQQLIIANPYTYVSENYISDLVERYNRSVMYWNEGQYSVWYLPQGYNPDNFIEYDTASMNKAYEAYDYAISHGFSNVKAMYDNAYELLAAEVDNIQSAVCARVTVQFTQKMTMTREAFNGTLQIFNGHESIPMEDIFVDFRIEDQQGNDCTNLFQINTLSLDQITGISGDGSLAAQTNGTALVQFIPTRNAAPTQPTVYYFGGSFSFIDPFTGEGLTYPLYPVEITVNPSPDLYVDYFMQRDILGDDALTEDVVEPSVPAELGVIIHNQGAGMAKNVLLETAEPQIIDNEKGLAIDFAMYGASFNGSPRQLGLMQIPFGNIGSGQTAVGEWLFTSSLLGHFVSYDAHVIHNSSYGNPDLSLVSHLDIHELIHPVYAYGNLDDGINDFLVNDNPDAYDTPDSIYFSHGGKTSVGVVDGISFDHLVSPTDSIVTLTVVPSRIGWNYGVTDDPGMSEYYVVSCIRNNDNQVIPLNNVWLTFVTIPDGGDPVYENKLHIVDTVSAVETVTYTLTYSVAPPEPSHIPIGAIDGLFSISSSQQAYFSKGNLQYQATTNIWRFADNQWDYVGDANSNIGQNYSGWIDLFGWGTSGYDHGATRYQPWSTIQNHFDYYAYGNWQYNLYDQSGKADWGCNPIANGGNQANQWRTLSHDEWNYVLNTRSTTSGIRYAKATVNNVYGVLLLPDDWSSSIYSLNDTNDNEANYDSNILTATQWRVLEQEGVVFLPAAGRRYGTDIGEAGQGSYWSATHDDIYEDEDWGAFQLNFKNDDLNADGINARDNGISVRLVKPKPVFGTYTINTTCSPVGGGTVTGADTYNVGETCTLTATANAGYTFTNWTENGIIVSPDEVYSFIVSEDRTLVANFTSGMLSGVFSVSNNTKVCFSQGNLQYQASTNTWRFAEHQWDCLKLENANISSSYYGWIDLFGWGTSGYDHGAICYQPWSSITNGNYYNAYGQSDYNLYDQTGQADWGYNAISNGGNQENRWRTLTKNEWNYVFNNRNTTSGIRYAKANISGVDGVILLPDGWDVDTYALSNTNDAGANFSSNILTASQWGSLEQSGAVFLPAAGRRRGTTMNDVGSGGYWSATCGAYRVYFDNSSLDATNWYFRDNGFSVRLVRAIQYTIISASLPAVGGTVTGAGTYNAGETCTLTATAKSGYTFTNWTENGTIVSTDPVYSFTVSEDRTLVANFSNGSLNGVFSVSNNTKVYFSQGNLQYQASTNTWRFAENQWDCLGLENANASSTYDGWIDLFGWGTSGYDHGANRYQPWSTDGNYDDYYAYGVWNKNLNDESGMADWGYNAISNGGNTENLWRTLTSDEWSYLLLNRNTPSGIRFAKAVVNNVEGLVVIPDNWDASYYGLNETNNTSANYSTNIITENDWTSVLEPYGALFLPAGSHRVGTSVIYSNPFEGNYWTSSCLSYECCAKYVEFNNTQLFVHGKWRTDGLSVRLAKTIQHHFITIGKWSTPVNWLGGALPDSTDEVFIEAPCQLDQNATVAALSISNGQSLLLQSGKTLAVTGNLTNSATTGLVIEDGAQLVHNVANVQATVKKLISPFNGTDDGWHLIALPLTGSSNVASVTNLLENGYDLYGYEEATTYWRNQKHTESGFTSLEATKGYLYANEAAVTLEFSGTLQNSSDTISVPLNYTTEAHLSGFNLVGNPFPCNAYLNKPYYVLDENGTGINPSAIPATTPIPPCTAVFVKAEGDGETVVFSRVGQ